MKPVTLRLVSKSVANPVSTTAYNFQIISPLTVVGSNLNFAPFVSTANFNNLVNSLSCALLDAFICFDISLTAFESSGLLCLTRYNAKPLPL